MSIDINHIDYIKALFDKITWYQDQLNIIQQSSNINIALTEHTYESGKIQHNINFSEPNPVRDLFIADIRRPLITIMETKITECITELKLYNVEISQ